MYKHDKIYLEMAHSWSKASYAKRKQVGCIIVKDRTIISDGINGNISMFPNVCEDENGNTHEYTLHAESNALTKLMKSTQSSREATMYVTLSPCLECAKLIIQAEISRVVYIEEYRNTKGIELLNAAGIKVEQINL